MKKLKSFIAVVMALAMMFSLNVEVFAAGDAPEYTVYFYDGGNLKETATYTYNDVGEALPACGADGWKFEVYTVNQADGSKTLHSSLAYTSSADNNVVTEELMGMLASGVDLGSVGYEICYEAYTNRDQSSADDSYVGKNAVSSRANMLENMFQMMGFASTVGGGNDKYFAEGTTALAGTVYNFLNMTEELFAYLGEDGYVTITYEAYMNIANAYFVNAPEMKSYLIQAGYMDAEQIHYYLGGMGGEWEWVLTSKDFYRIDNVSGYKLRGIFCSGIVSETDITDLTEYVDYYDGMYIDSAVELTVVDDEEHGFMIAAYCEKDYYLADTEEMGDCLYVYNEETKRFSDVYYLIYSNSGDYGITFELEEGTYTKIDNFSCYSADQTVAWTAKGDGRYDCEVEVTRTFEGETNTFITGHSGVISGGGEVWLWSIPFAVFRIDAPHATVEVLQGLTDLGDGTYAYYQGDAIELKITPDTGYEITEVASFLYDVYVVMGDYISASGTWVICPEFLPSTILVTTAQEAAQTDGDGKKVTIVSDTDSAAVVTVQISQEDAEKVNGLTLVVEKLEEKAEKKAVSMVVEHLGAEEDNVYILDIHFENTEGEETKVNAAMLVTIPIPEGWDPANVSVYYVNSDTGEVADMNAVVGEDGKSVTFTTNHFSYYALVQTTAKQTTPADGIDSTSPQTGDKSNPALWFALLILAGAGLAGVKIYSKKEKYQR